MSCWLPPSGIPPGYDWVFRHVRESCHVFTALLGIEEPWRVAQAFQLSHEMGVVGSSPCTCWLWGAVQGAVQGLCRDLSRNSSSVRSTSGREVAELTSTAQSCLKQSPELAGAWFPFPVTAVSAQSPLLECGFFSLLLPAIAFRLHLPVSTGVANTGTALQSTAGSASASEELETPQEELGVTLPQQEGFLLFEADNEYLQCGKPSCKKRFSLSLWIHLSLLWQSVPQGFALLQDLCVCLGNPFPCGDTLGGAPPRR